MALRSLKTLRTLKSLRTIMSSATIVRFGIVVFYYKFDSMKNVNAVEIEYKAENIFYTPTDTRWSVIAAKAHTPEINECRNENIVLWITQLRFCLIIL